MKGFRFWPERPPGPLDDAYRQTRRLRPYRPGPWRVALCVALLVVLMFGLEVALVAVFAKGTYVDAVLRVLLGVGLVAVLVWAAVRSYRAGVWVTDDEVRVVRPFSTWVWPWSSVADVRSVPGRVRVLGTPMRAEGEVVVLVLADGSDVETPVSSRSPDFLGRAEAYDMASGAVEGWLEQHHRRHHGGGTPGGGPPGR